MVGLAATAYMPATEMARLIRTRAVSPVEVVNAALERIEALNPSINALVEIHHDSARAHARAAESAVLSGDTLPALHGVPICVKDNVAQAGFRYTNGSLLLRDNVAFEDAPIVSRLKRGGAIIVGRTNTPEFAWRGSTDNRLFGATRNPWDTARTAGGSSGGAAAAVAAGLVPLAIGTDGAGSIRIPASFCGIFGLKPSFGRVPMYPSAGPSESLAHAGPMTHSISDAACLLDVIAGPDERDRNSLPASNGSFANGLRNGVRGLRVAWSPDLGHIPVEPEVQRVAESASHAFAELGAVLDLPQLNLPNPEPVLDVIYGAVQVGNHGARPADELAEMDQDLVRYVDAHRYLSAAEIGQAAMARARYWDGMRQVFENYDLLVTPTLSVTAFELGIVGPTQVAGRSVSHLAWTLCYPFNLTGQPAATVPCGFTSAGLPVGLQIIGPRFADALVLRAAAAFEAARPWADRHPPL